MPDFTAYEPQQPEQNILARIDTMVGLSMKGASAKRKQMRRNEQMKSGDHFAIFPNLDKDKQRVVYNMTFEVIETIMPILAELLPKPDVVPEPTQIKGLDLNDLLKNAEELEDGIQYQWRKAGMREDWPMALKTALIYGQCPIRCLPRKESNFLDIDLVDNFGFLLDGGGATTVKDSEWIITMVPIYMSELVRIYGEEETRGINPQGRLDGFRQFHLFPEKSRDSASSTGGGSVTTDTDGAATTLDLDEKGKVGQNRNLGMVLLTDVWCRHRISDQDPDPNERPEPMEKYHHVTRAGKRVLADETSDYPVGEPPFVMVVNYPEPKSPWGIGEPEQIESLNVAADVLLTEANNAAVMGGNPPVTVTEDMKAANPTGLNLKPNKTVWMKNKATVIKWMEPKQVSPALVGLPMMISEMINTVSGVHDATAGRKPGGVTAASAIAKLQDAANSRINYKEKSSLRGPLTDLYGKMLKHIEGLEGDDAFISRNRADGRAQVSTYGPKNFKNSQYSVTAGVPITENKTDLVSMLLEIAPLLGLTPDELIALMPPELRDLIQAVRNRGKDQGPLAGLDTSKLTEPELAILQGDDEDAIADLLISLKERGIHSMPLDEDLQAAQNGAAGVTAP